MADSTINELNLIDDIADNDVIPIYDVSDTEAKIPTKKGTFAKILGWIRTKIIDDSNTGSTTTTLSAKKISDSLLNIDAVNVKITKKDDTKKSLQTMYEDGEFGGSDDYSTKETVIGKWINGKPLYRRVIENVAWTNNEWNTNIFSKINVSTMDNWTYVFGVIPNQRAISVIQFDKNAGLWATASTTTNGIVILEYTKTTD